MYAYLRYLMDRLPNGKRVVGINYMKLDGVHLAKNVDTDKFVILQDAFEPDNCPYSVADSESERVVYKEIEVEEESPQVAEVIKKPEVEEKEIKTENGPVTSLNGVGNNVNNSKVNSPEFEKPNTVKLNNNQEFRQNFNNNRNFQQANQKQQAVSVPPQQQPRQPQQDTQNRKPVARHESKYKFAPTNYD